MKYLLFGLLCLFPSYLNGQEVNAIQERINTLFIATDQQEWHVVEECFSPNVVLDYSSMTGEQAVEMAPQQITELWKSILPGFDYIHHQVGNVIVKEDNGKATLFCYGTATHYLENENENVWTVVGTYDFDLEQDKSGWKISTMKFNFKYQTGNLELPQMAIHRLTSKQNPPFTAEQNKSTVRRFFQALEDEDVETLVNLFAEHGKHVNPYHSDLFPTGADGREGIRAYWTPVFPNFDGMEFPIEEIYAMEDPTMVYVKFSGIIKLKNNAGYYENDYYSTFKFNADGEIIEYVENL